MSNIFRGDKMIYSILKKRKTKTNLCWWDLKEMIYIYTHTHKRRRILVTVLKGEWNRVSNDFWMTAKVFQWHKSSRGGEKKNGNEFVNLCSRFFCNRSKKSFSPYQSFTFLWNPNVSLCIFFKDFFFPSKCFFFWKSLKSCLNFIFNGIYSKS